jgi:hypothetical protein
VEALADMTVQIVRFSRLRLLLVFVPLFVLLAISVAMNPDRWLDAEPWVYAIFGGIALLLVLGTLFLPFFYYLRLTPEGLTIHYIGSERFFTWSEVRGFRVQRRVRRGALAQLVVFDLTEDSSHRTTLNRLTSAVNGYDISILATFTISASDLANLLEDWQRRFGRAGSQFV